VCAQVECVIAPKCKNPEQTTKPYHSMQLSRKRGFSSAREQVDALFKCLNYACMKISNRCLKSNLHLFALLLELFTDHRLISELIVHAVGLNRMHLTFKYQTT